MGNIPVWVWFSSAMLLLAGWYLWWRLVAGTTVAGSRSRRVLTVLVAVLAVCGPLGQIAQFTMPLPVQRVLGWPAWVGYGGMIFVGFATVLTEPFRIADRWRRNRATNGNGRATENGNGEGTENGPGTETRNDPTSVSRRLVFRRALAGAAVVAGGTTAGIGVAGALAPPRIRTATIAVRGLPPEASGLRVVLISDLHLGSVTRAAECRRVVELINAQRPDLVCLAGDFSDGSADDLAADFAPLGDLAAPDGVYFVTGNHEFYFDVDSWLAHIPTLGITVLDNRGVQVRGVLLAGVHDITGESSGRGPDLDAALRTRRVGQPAILLSHSPSIVDEAVTRDVDLLLSGHTHGGQFYPMAWIIGLTTPVLSGLRSFGRTQVFVTNGCRFWGPVSRLGVPPDLSVLTLVPAQPPR